MKKGTARSTPGERETKARAAQLTALHKTLLDITAQRDLTKLLQAIVRRAGVNKPSFMLMAGWEGFR